MQRDMSCPDPNAPRPDLLFANAKIAKNHVQNVFHVDPAK
jgi:hypothetical protein